MKTITDSPEETGKIGEDLARRLPQEKREKALVIEMRGDLGGGKTTFLKGFARGLGIKDNILSPTFVIFRVYDISFGRYKKFYHFDCYRIEEADLSTLGFKEIIENPDNIVAIEWSERIDSSLFKDSVKVDMKFIDENKREILID